MTVSKQQKRRRVPTEGSRALRKAIRERGLTLEDAGELLGVDRFTLWRWIHGLCVPAHGNLCVIEDRLGVQHRAWLVRCTRVHDR